MSLSLRDFAKKKTGKCGNFEKTGGGSTRIPLPFFTVFNIGDLPKNSHIFPFFWGGNVPKHDDVHLYKVLMSSHEFKC